MSVKNPADMSRLRAAGIRPTHQRLAVAGLLQDAGTHHFTADEMFRRATEAGLRIPLATIYNALNDFAKAGLIRRIDLGEKTSFCANQAHHHHYLDLSTGRLSDISDPQPFVGGIPAPPATMDIDGIDIIIRLRPK